LLAVTALVAGIPDQHYTERLIAVVDDLIRERVCRTETEQEQYEKNRRYLADTFYRLHVPLLKIWVDMGMLCLDRIISIDVNEKVVPCQLPLKFEPFHPELQNGHSAVNRETFLIN